MKLIKNVGLVVAVALLVTAGAAFAANEVDVIAGCASEGSFGMVVTHDGSTNNAFVETDAPESESVLRMSFDWDTDTMIVPHGAKYFIAAALPEAAGSRPAQMLCSFNNANGYKCWCQYIQNNGIKDKTAKVSVSSSGFSTLMLEWVQSAAAPDPPDGSCKITNVTTAESQEKTGERNAAFSVGRMRLGIPGRANVITAGGQHCYDDFQSFRTLAP